MDIDNVGVGQICHRITYAWYNMCKGIGNALYGRVKLIEMW